MTVQQQVASGDWTIDPARSEARFSMKYLVVATLHGRLGAIEGAISIDAEDPARSSVQATIDVSGIRTGNGLRDRHLRSVDFFDAKRFPLVTFVSTDVDVIDGTRMRVLGDLTVRDVTEPVVLEATFGGQDVDADGSRRASFVATTTLSRRAFGLGRSAGVVANDSVDVTLQISAVSA